MLVIAGLAGWAYAKLDYHFEEVDKGYEGEARSNPYLAAEFFLRQMGQPAEQIKLFSAEPGLLNSDDTLLIPGVRLAFDSRRSAKILDWVEQGGHLIMTAKPQYEDDSANRDHILDKLAIVIKNESYDEALQKDPVNLDIEDEDDFWQVDFDDSLVIEFTPEFNQQIIWSISDEDRMHGVQIKLGNGRLTLLSEMRMFRNDYIDKYDHAAFLFSLSNDQLISSDTGVFYYSLFEAQGSLLLWLWKNAQALLISLIIFGVVVLWMLIPRFGPLINVQQPVRRQFMDHLSASGNYHWRQKHYVYLLSEVRKQLSMRVKIKHPEWVNLSKQSQISHFAELSHLQAVAIESALFDNDIKKINDFVNTIKLLEKMRKSL